MQDGMNELASALRLGKQVAREQAACPDEPAEEVEARVAARMTDDEARRRATLEAGAARGAVPTVEDVDQTPERWQEESERRQERQEG